MTTHNETKPHVSIPHRQLALYGALAIGLAIVVNGGIRVIARVIFAVPTGYDPLGWGPIVTTTIVAGAGATIVFGLLTRISNRPRTHFTRVAIIVLLLSFVPIVVPPDFLAQAPASVLVTLGILHVSTAVVVIGVFHHRRGHGGRT